MTPTTREHALAAMKQAGLEKRIDMDSLLRFWQAAMEHAAGICEAEHLIAPTDCADDIAYDIAVNDCAAAIRQAAK